MKTSSQRSILLFLTILVAALALGALITSAFGAINEAEVHQNSKSYQTQTCNSCHDKYSTVSGAAGGWWDAHRRHFVSIFLNFADNDGGVDAYGCAKCHQETTPPTYFEGDASVVKSDAMNEARKTVRPGVCQECHGKFRKTKHRFGGVEYDYVQLRSDCNTCHNPDGPGLDPEIAHGSAPLESSTSVDPVAAGVWWINQRYANLKDFCIRCHGGLAWFEVEETNPGISCSYDLCHKTSESSFLNTAVADFLYDTTVTGSHALHFDSVKGPGPCSTCHATVHDSCDGCHGDDASTGDHTGHRDDVVNLVDTTHGPVYTNNATLTNTPACDRCHSPEGAYNGVDSTTDSVGAKDSWSAGVYDTTETLSAGKEKWCVGCHDDEPAVVLGQTAQNVGGDAANYGFFKSGHGLDASSTYDDDLVGDAAGNPGGAIGCDDCHDLAKDHLNGVDDSSFDGQRLSSTVNGTTTPSVVRVCEGCHQNSFGSLSATRQVSTHGNTTTGGYTDPIEEPFSIDCDVCHEPHGNNYAGGSRNLKMVKTVFNGTNTVAFRSSTGLDSYDEDAGDPSDTDDICVTCHINPANNPGYDTSLHAGGDNHSILGDQRGNDCMGCHKHNSFSDSTVTPSDGFTPGGACNICHTFPPGGVQGTYQGSATHDIHTTDYAFGCSVCHNDFPVGHNESNVASKDDWQANFDPANVDIDFSPLNASGTTSETTVASFSARGYDRNVSCENLYCHGQSGSVNGKSFADLGGTNLTINTPKWDDGYNDNAANKFAITRLTGDCGTCHDTTANNQAQGGTFWPIWDTTNSQNDWTDTTQPIVWDVTSGTSIGSTSTQLSHAAHLDKLRGPKESCNQCHKTPPTVIGTESPGGPSTHINQKLDFLDSTNTMAVTNACDYCHAPNGVYDGVNSTSISIGAKDNWDTGVYQTDGRLTPSKERWCVGCHDTPGSNIKDVTATPVNGDNVNYGFYATGHGQKNMVKCTDCHDLLLEHIDGDVRTYGFTGSTQSPQRYREGFRLRLVDGQYPLTVPMRGSTGVGSDFRLCFKCHNQSTIFSDTQTVSINPGTNFRRDGPWSPYSGNSNNDPFEEKNLHFEMINPYPGNLPAVSVLYDSDWDDSTDDGGGSNNGFDSFPQCITCHNPHGSEYPAMIRDGRIIGKRIADGGAFNGLEFSYVTTETTSAPGTWARSTDVKVDSDGGVMRFLGDSASKGTCITAVCHDDELSLIAPAPVYQIDADPFPTFFPPAPGKPQLIDYYRPVVPVITSVLFTSDNTIAVVFTEPVTASLADFQNIVLNSSGPVVPSAISGSGSEIIQLAVGGTPSDITGTLKLNTGPAGIVSTTNGTPLSPVFDQKIWDGRD